MLGFIKLRKKTICKQIYKLKKLEKEDDKQFLVSPLSK